VTITPPPTDPPSTPAPYSVTPAQWQEQHAELTAVIYKHQWKSPADYGYGPSECTGCRWAGDWRDQGEQHAAHVARVVMSLYDRNRGGGA